MTARPQWTPHRRQARRHVVHCAERLERKPRCPLRAFALLSVTASGITPATPTNRRVIIIFRIVIAAATTAAAEAGRDAGECCHGRLEAHLGEHRGRDKPS